MQTAAFRLSPDVDLKQSLLEYCVTHRIEAACVIACVGSLRCASLRYAGRSETTRLEQKLEIVSLVGTLSRHGCHLHIALADENGQVTGGHLMDQSRIYTTAEIVLGIIPGISFRRAPDPVTGYQELLVTPTDAGSAMPQAGTHD